MKFEEALGLMREDYRTKMRLPDWASTDCAYIFMDEGKLYYKAFVWEESYEDAWVQEEEYSHPLSELGLSVAEIESESWEEYE